MSAIMKVAAICPWVDDPESPCTACSAEERDRGWRTASDAGHIT